MLELEDRDKLIITILCGVVALAIAYSKYLETQQDMTELALSSQTSVAPTRKPGETAHHRNLLVPHGFPLLHGLSIKHSYKLRDGNVRDIWALAMEHQADTPVQFFTSNGKPKLSTDYLTLNKVFADFYNKIMKEFTLASDGDGSLNLKIGTVLPAYSWQGVVLAMTCFINNLTLHTFHTHMLKYNVGDLDVLVVTKKDLRTAVRHYRTVKVIVVIDDDDDDVPDRYSMEDYKRATLPNKLVTWEEFFGNSEVAFQKTNHDEKNGVYDYQYDGKFDDFIPLKETLNFNTVVYTNQNLVSCVAHELKQLPMGQEWSNSNDELVILNEDSSLSFYNKFLAGLVVGLPITIVEPLKLHEIRSIDFDDVERQQEREDSIIYKKFFKLFNKFQQSVFTKQNVIAVIPERYLKVIYEKEIEEFSKTPMLRKFLIGRSQVLLQQNVFNKLAPHPSKVFDRLRVIYSYSYKNSRDSCLTSWQLSMLRTITGSRIINERYIPGTIGPLFMTQLYDYRTVEDDAEQPEEDDIVKKDYMVLRGVPSQTIEIKLADYHLLDEEYAAEDGNGELCIRGFIIGRSIDSEIVEQKIKDGQRVGGEGWMPTGLVGKIADDGCFYEKVYELY
ncbi:hypothetical protein DASC09_004120 [Saccharomycopsis crataegensis]|uniref:Uncharacterized protein n=1 Tax=Saccharomycopsis crataegensis TaxID=43959 RepID=A0AAV5QEB2_9ASCO|nr:hypothetical protein DASC09_004120 [Saccharomycopsis crataegensis]